LIQKEGKSSNTLKGGRKGHSGRKNTEYIIFGRGGLFLGREQSGGRMNEKNTNGERRKQKKRWLITIDKSRGIKQQKTAQKQIK